MTIQEFYEGYAERTGVEPHVLAAHGKRAYACSCGDKTCGGFAMMPQAIVEESRAFGLPLHGISQTDPGWAPGDPEPEEPEEPAKPKAARAPRKRK